MTEKNIQTYLTKCLELIERATKGPWIPQPTWTDGVTFDFVGDNHVDLPEAELIAFSRTALPKVCKALRIAMAALKESTDDLWPEPARKAIAEIESIFNDADGG